MANLNFTPEQMEAAKNAKSPEELVGKAKEQGVDITQEQAAAFLAPQKEGELSDEELENVAGGYCKDDRGREVVTKVTPCVHGLKALLKNGDGTTSLANSNQTRMCGRTFALQGEFNVEIGLGIRQEDCKYLSYEKGMWYCNYNVMPH